MRLESTRIVLIDLPPLLREIVRDALSREPDLDVVAEHPGDVDVRAAVAEADADFVIVGPQPSVSPVASVIAGQRRLRALELRAEGGEGVLYELRPHRVPLGEMSSAALLRTIRAFPTWDDEP